MENMTPNASIQCTVAECKNHCDNNHCGLNSVKIGTHEANPTKCACVDCESFVLRDGCKTCG